MSLKAVHLVFVGAFSSLAFACMILKGRSYFSPAGSTGDLLFAIGSLLAGMAILVYGKYFLKKLKHISYL
ncbi:MAG: hypothetical protein U1F65_11120 [Verrucomicrobiota bacterium]